MPRKEKKFHFIYKTTNLLTSKFYIGMHSTDNLEDGYMGSGKRLWYSRKKYGDENHSIEILEYCNNRKELRKREEEIVNDEFINENLCMNLVIGGGGFMMDEHHYKCSKAGGKASLESRKNDSELMRAHKERASKAMKKLHSEGKIKYDTFTGKKHTEETKKLMSESMKGIGIGKNNSQYGTCWITRDGENKKIKKEELKTFIQQGWEKGRKTKYNG